MQIAKVSPSELSLTKMWSTFLSVLGLTEVMVAHTYFNPQRDFCIFWEISQLISKVEVYQLEISGAMGEVVICKFMTELHESRISSHLQDTFSYTSRS